ncbi:MAG: hypothetical protein FGM14_15690 [Flavobacteriales bacterium]|nr:hypothetical protein [Flavobacteriales bacterium]
MKSFYLIFSILVLAALSSCKKDTDDGETPTDELFISFTIDGVQKKYVSNSSTSNNTNGGSSGNSAYTGAGFFDFEKDIYISLDLEKDSIVGADLEALIGQKIQICDICPVSMGMRYDIDGDDYSTSASNNPYPANYFKINSVTFYRLNNTLGQNAKEYFVTGEFTTKLNYSTTVKNVTNGQFRLIFQEVTD